VEGAAIIKRYRKELIQVKDWLFYFLLVWTVVILVLAWFDFFFKTFVMPELVAVSYIILLAVYIAHKEVGRWTGVVSMLRPGEIMVFAWWGTLLLMLSLNFFFPKFNVPGSLSRICFEILFAFLASEISKSLNVFRRYDEKK
jgi:hypothetical protein